MGLGVGEWNNLHKAEWPWFEVRLGKSPRTRNLAKPFNDYFPFVHPSGNWETAKTLWWANAHKIILLQRNEWLEHWKGEPGRKIHGHKGIYVSICWAHSTLLLPLIHLYLESQTIQMQTSKTDPSSKRQKIKKQNTKQKTKPIIDDFKA